jgi:hypothetical protein
MEELLQKAKIRSLSLKEIAEVVRKPPSLDEETLKNWKVEMAASAASELLDEIFQAVIETPKVDKPEEESLNAILNVRYLRSLIPVALGIVMWGGSLSEEIKNLQPAAANPQLRSRVGRERLINSFLPAFRDLAKKVVNKGHNAVDFNQVASLVDQHFSQILPSDIFRRHIATTLADILRIIAAPPEEVESALNRGFETLSSLYKHTLLSEDELFRLGFQTREQVDIALTYLPVAAMLQYYVDRLAAGRPHTALLQVAGVLDEVPVEGLDSYFPVLWYAATPPEARRNLGLQSLARQSPYKLLTNRGIVTSIGTNVLSVNKGAGIRLITEIASLMGVKLSLGGWVKEAINRQIPRVMLGFLNSLENVLSFLRDNWSAIKDEINENKAPALAAIVNGLGLKYETDETVMAVLDNKLEELGKLRQIYGSSEEALIRSLPDYILSLSERLDGVLGQKSQDILSKINQAVVEVGTYFTKGDKRLEIMTPLADQAVSALSGGYTEVRLGVTVRREPQKKGRGRRPAGEDIVGSAFVDLVNYILDGPSEKEDEPSQKESYLDWFRKLKAGIELALWGETSEERERMERGEEGGEIEDEAVKHWRGYGIDWKKVANERKEKKWGAYIKTASWWEEFFREVVGNIQEILSDENKPEEVKRQEIESLLRGAHEELQKEISEAWKSKLANSVVSSVYRRLTNLQSQYPEMLAEYIRAARAAALSSRIEMVSIEEEIPGTSGLTRADTLVAEVGKGIVSRAEDMAELVINALVNLVSKVLAERRARNVGEAFSTPEVREFFDHVGRAIEDDEVLLDSIDRILNEIEAGTRRWEGLPTSFDMGEFVAAVDEEIDRILKVEQPSEPEEAAVPVAEEPESVEEIEETEMEARAEEVEAEAKTEVEEEREVVEEEEKILMKFYLLSKVLPPYSS